MRETIRINKTAEITLKQIANQEFQVKMGKIEIWRQIIMQEVEQNLQAIGKVHKKAMKTQRHSFKKEIELVKKRL